MIQSSLYFALKKDFKATILLTKDEKEAKKAYEIARFLQEEKDFTPILLPEFRAKFGDDMRSFNSEFMELLAKIRVFYQAHNPFLIAPVSSLLYPLPSQDMLKTFDIQKNKSYDFSELKNKLIFYGYEAVEIVELEGEVSFRGDIIDIFIPFSGSFRISFFDTQCESIRKFDPETQISQPEEINVLNVPPALFSLDEKDYIELLNKVEQSDFNTFSKDIHSLGFWYIQDKNIDFIKNFSTFITQEAIFEIEELSSIDESIKLSDFKNLSVLPSPQDGSLDIDFNPKILDSMIALNKNKKIKVLARNNALFKTLPIQENIECILSDCIINLSSPQELILSLNILATPKQKQKKSKLVIDELNIGEYIVHNDYGIGIFRGITQTTILGHTRDFIRLDYQGEDKLLLPMENLNMIQRYIGGSGNVPIIDRLGKGSFIKLKEKVRIKLFEIADSIIKLAAQRNLIEGIKLDTSLPEIQTFRSCAPFKLTIDQEKSIDEIFNDLKSGKVMDRLLTGDVGFGKTEVAINAIFTTIKNGYQAAIIVPTTLLCNQHFISLKERLNPYGIKVAKLDRFIKSNQKTSIIKDLLNGEIDVVVGTHSLLNTKFKNLALMVVDEEHKFGVKQKESIKKISKDIHLLSMSATPIPRTLNMALSKIKGISSLLTPPIERLPSKTFLKENSPVLIKEIIHRELRRDGQIFYIHNNIATISKIKSQLKDLIPNLKIAILHSQIDSAESEGIMLDFIEKKYHLLLCTSIVEAGIHLPNANTIIINGADRFGLADLHQLRGRVGRGNKEGFCYFLIKEKKELTKDAEKRLLALEKNSYLGSGEAIAYHDLEIRGGGNLIGEAQSGHIKNIGYGLYLRMLEEAINQLSGNITKDSSVRTELKLNISAYLNPDLIGSDRLRLDIYRRLSLCKEVNEVYEIEGELEDRFGKPDRMSLQFLQLIIIKILANKQELKSISNYSQNIMVINKNDEKITLNAPSKDDDEILATILSYLRNQ